MNEINLQFHVRRLRETWRSKTGDQEFTEQIFKSVMICVCAYLYTYRRVIGRKGAVGAFFERRT